ncbi:MAG: hypothetical protein ACTHMJ_09100 [Thermomicrobiales bacterium]
MHNRAPILLVSLLLLLLLVACGLPGATPRPGAGGTPPPASTPTLPAGQKPPRPVPDPTAVATGASLRTTLLAQIDDYEREAATCAGVGTPTMNCASTALAALRSRAPDLAAYVSWYSTIERCISDGKGGYNFVETFAFIPPSPAALREPGTLDVYVSGTPWCDQTRPA